MIKTLNNKKYLAVLLSAVMLLGACSNEVTDFSLKEAVTETTNDTGNVSYEESTKAIKQDVTGSFPAFYNTQIGKCTFSIDKIDSPEEITLYSGTASKTNADYLGLAKELLKGEAYNTVEETGELYVIESADENYTKYKYTANTDGTIHFIDHSIPYFQSVKLDYEDPYFNLNSYAAEHSFSFGSPEKCLEDIYSLFERYGLDIRNGFNVETYYLDHDTLAKEEKVYDKDGNINTKKNRPDGWSEHDDAYLFLLNQKCHGLPDSFHESFLWAGWFSPVSNAGIAIVYNEKGIAIIEPRQTICKYSLNTETVQLLPFESVANGVAEHLNGSADTSKTYEITKAKLYVAHDDPDNSAETPLEYHWAFLIRENSNGKSKSYELYFNAVTGESEEY